MLVTTMANANVSAKCFRFRHARGFTLTEMGAVLALAAILAGLAMPNMRDIMTNDRIRVGGTDLMSALLTARSEAIKRNGQVQVRPASGTDWTTGWVVASVATGEQYDTKNPLGNGVQVNLAPASIVYDRNGRLAAIGATRVEFADVDGRVPTRCLAIGLSGLPRLSHGSCT
jgi:type IV fimbrial biogenesis protein FimT